MRRGHTLKEEEKMLVITSGGTTTPSTASTIVDECCMCGDHGVSSELVRCNSCHFRFQHRYCSNLYPDAASYDTCNWCVSAHQDDGRKEEKQKHGRSTSQKLVLNSSRSSPHKRKSGKINGRTRDDDDDDDDDDCAWLELNRPTKRPNNSPGKPLATATTRKTRSETAMANAVAGVVTRRVLRNRVLRYKLLDEVSARSIPNQK